MAVRVLIAAGGTAGHVAPALAVADVLRERGCEVVFAGTADRAEGRMVPARGYPLETFRVTGFERRVSPQLARSVGIAALAPAACGRILRRIRPHVVLGGGGYVAGPMVAAAAALRIPTVLTETDGRVGLANRLAGPLARRVLLAVPIAGLEGARYRVVGRPVDPAFFTVTRDEARAAYGIAGDEQVVAVFGGSLGAGRLNTAVTEAYGEEDPAAPLVLHVTGRGKLEGTQPHDRLRVFEYCDSMPQLLHAADLVVCRAGGIGVGGGRGRRAGDPRALVGRHGRPPDGELPLLRGRRRRGARRRAGRRAAAVRGRRRCWPTSRAGAGLAAAMRDLARPDAASDVADELLALAGTRAA